jgi:alkylated DNA repair protein (DNA oxidative demethylase)
MKTADLFDDLPGSKPQQLSLGEGALLLRGFVTAIDHILLGEIEAILAQAPLRHMITPGGFRMSVAMSNCGSVGWVADKRGYRYDAIDFSGCRKEGGGMRRL